MGKRRAARELALKVLFQIDVGKLPAEEVLETSFEQVPVDPEEQAYVTDVVQGVLACLPELDRIIGSLAAGWKLDRIANVDKNVLRIALYEIIHREDIPPSVSVNEAIEIAKKYSTEDSGKFVNGILGSYLRQHGSTPIEPSAVLQPSSVPAGPAVTDD
jgi:transcription antitermination protein NusB